MTAVLVTGGTGFLGAALVRSLVAGGASVTVLDNNLRGSPRRLGDIADKVRLVEADIRDAAAVSAAARGVDSIVHMAFINGTETFYSHPGLVLDVGTRGMLSVLDACAEHGVRSLLLVSSSEVYQRPDTIPTPEAVPLVVPDPHNPRYTYGGAKIISELLALHGHGFRPALVRIVRPHNVYGPDMGFKHVIPQLCMRLATTIETAPATGPVTLPIRGDGTQTRAFVHIDDFTRGLRLVMEHGEDGGIYHVGTGEQVSIAALARVIAQALGREVVLEPGAVPVGETDRRCPDIARIVALGYTPAIPLAAGIPPVTRWYRDNRPTAATRVGDLS